MIALNSIQNQNGNIRLANATQNIDSSTVTVLTAEQREARKQANARLALERKALPAGANTANTKGDIVPSEYRPKAGESFAQSLARADARRQKTRERVAKHRANAKQTVRDTATKMISTRMADIAGAVSASDGVRGMDGNAVAECDPTAAVTAATRALADTLKIGTRLQDEIIASLTVRFGRGFSSPQNKRASFLNTLDTPIDVMWERRKDELRRVEKTIDYLDAYRAMGRVNNTRVDGSIAHDPLLAIVAPAPVRLVSPGNPTVQTVCNREVLQTANVSDASGSGTNRHVSTRKVTTKVRSVKPSEVVRVLGGHLIAPAARYAHTPSAGASNMEVFTQTERMESAQSKAEKLSHMRTNYVMAWDETLGKRVPREIITREHSSVALSLASQRQTRLYPAGAVRQTVYGHSYTPLCWEAIRPLLPCSVVCKGQFESANLPSTPKVTQHTVTLHPQYAPVLRTSEGYAYSTLVRPSKRRVYNYVDATTRNTPAVRTMSANA